MNIILICYVIVSNLIGFLLMRIDKSRAQRRKYRIPERTLFMTAILGGSIGMLIGMHLFRHKTLHRSFVLGIPAILVVQIILVGWVLSMNRKHMESPSQAVAYELDLIRKLDEDTIQSFVSYETLTGSQTAAGEAGPEAAGAVRLFFRNFKYRILDETITDNRAEVNVRITNLDTAALARDLRTEILRQSASIFPGSPAPASAGDYYRLLLDTLSQNRYPRATTTACFHLIRDEAGWTILADDQLEDQLVSGFITNISDPYLVSARTVLKIYLDAFGALTSAQWKEFLGISDIFSLSSEKYSPLIDEEYADQIADCFSCKILSCDEDGTLARADVRVTSLNLKQILDAYRDSLLAYAATLQSVKDDHAVVSDEIARLLLEALQKNKKTASTDVTLTMTNDGSTWNITFNKEFTDALMGNAADALDAFTSGGDSSSLPEQG